MMFMADDAFDSRSRNALSLNAMAAGIALSGTCEGSLRSSVQSFAGGRF